jgi:hypothetical protein
MGFCLPTSRETPSFQWGADLELACGGLPLHLHISAAVEQDSHASQERVTKGDFGAAKMRFGEGEERAARVSYAPLTSSPFPPSGRA